LIREAKIDFAVGDAYESPYAKGFFDVVVCNNLWDHVPDPLFLLSKNHEITLPSTQRTFGLKQESSTRDPAARRRGRSRPSGLQGLLRAGDQPDQDAQDRGGQKTSEYRIRRIMKSELVIIDEIGYTSIEKREANLFFNMISELYEKVSVIVTSNKSFETWIEMMGDSVMTTALLDCPHGPPGPPAVRHLAALRNGQGLGVFCLRRKQEFHSRSNLKSKAKLDDMGRPTVSTRIGRSGVICVLLILLSIPSPAQAQAKWKGSVVKDGDVTIVKNPEKPLYKTPILELREDLSIGGPDAQGDEAFDRVQGVVVDDAGAVYVLDYRASNIKAYDATGKYVRTIGRNGQGPGELESPTTLSLNRPRAELAVHVPPRGIVFFNTDGTFLRQLSFKGLIANRGLVDSRGQIYVVETIMDEKEPRYATRKLGPDASAVATISETPAQVKGGNKVRAFPPTGYFMIDRDDRLIYGYPET